jgi:hypothetical protein
MQDSAASPAGRDRPSGPSNGTHSRIDEGDRCELPNIAVLTPLVKDS